MSNPTELPDLDKLEAFATSSKSGDWHATEAMLNMLDEDHVLALVAAARRAQPEGEAPQADMAQLPLGLEFDGYHDSDEHYGKTILDLVRSRLEVDPDELQEGDVFYVSASWVQPQEWRVVRAGNPLEVERISPPAAPAATLSPLCGAQQNIELVVARLEQIVEGCDNASERAEEALICMRAESGKEAELGCGGSGKCGVGDLPCLGCVNCPSEDDAAQQAAAPGALAKSARALAEKWHKDAVDTGFATSEAAVELLEVLDAATSAPGTPEAPKQPAHGHRDDYYLLANGRRLGLEPISRVRNMPNWVLAMELFATGSTSARQLCRDAGVHPDSTITHRAAQLDGGQEGSGS